MASNHAMNKLARVKCKTYSVCMLYNKSEAVEKLRGLALASCNQHTDQLGYQSDQEKDVGVYQEVKLTVSDKMYCNCCDCSFEERKCQEQHYKSDWHRYNLRLKLGGFKPVKLEEFEKIADDVSSISGSEDEREESSEDESENQAKVKNKLALPTHIKSAISVSSDSESDGPIVKKGKNSSHQFNQIYLKTIDGELISLYRCLLYHKKSRLTEPSDLVVEVQKLPGKTRSAIFMSAGGHFAGAIFNGNNIVAHKTFHRYVVRAKRGTAQGSKDSQGNAPKSAGATLRRYNEAALCQEIQEWINSWSEDIKNCDFLFLRAPSFNRKIFYGGKNPPFRKDDSRMRVIPFPTRRPTYNEVKRVHEMLCSIECYGQESELKNVIPISPMRLLSLETGQLEIVPESTGEIKTDSTTSIRTLKETTKVKQSTNKDKGQVDPETVKHSLPDHLLGYESGSTTSESELIVVETVLTTEHLKEFDCSSETCNKKPKKKHITFSKHQVEPDEDIYAEERYHLQNAFYTACVTGDTQTLSALLVVFRGSDITPCVLTPANKTETRVTSPQSTPTLATLPSNDEMERVDFLDNRAVSNGNSTEHVNSRINTSSDEIQLDFQNGNKQHQTTNKTEDSDKPSDNSAPTASLENRSSTGASVPNTLSIHKATMRFGGYTLDQLSPLVTVDVLNKPFGDNKTTLLHVAAKFNHKKIISMLMKYGADPNTRDKNGRTPYAVSDTKDTKNEFRRFMAIYPDKYDYQKAQIPGPLSAEKEEEKKLKEAERKRNQKKNKAEKLKLQREEEAEKMAEDRDKKRFLSLSDREKRLLAAERRLVNQHHRDGSELPVLSRCYCCGVDITGKIPFEYSDFKFCTTKCLREHRSKNS